MEQQYICSESCLEKLMEDPDRQLQEWAIDRYFRLYPEVARKRAALLLQDPRETIVKGALLHLGNSPEDELASILQTLYMNGPPAVSALAMRILGRWKISEAVKSIEDRILQGALLAREQIDAMVEALGQIQDEKAYSLLKKTESAVRDAELTRWRGFYSALLSHGRSEDMKTLIGVSMDSSASEQKRHAALWILQAQNDPALNIPDLLYGNIPAVREYLLRRLSYLREVMGSEGAPSKAGFRAEEIEKLLNELDPESTHEAIEKLNDLSQAVETASGHEKELFFAILAYLRANPGSGDDYASLLCMAVSALLQTLIQVHDTAPQEDSPWQEKLSDLLKDRYPRGNDNLLQNLLSAEAPSMELLPLLLEHIDREPDSWGALRAVEILGTLRAVEAKDVLVRLLGRVHDSFFREEVENALTAMGPCAASSLIHLLDHPDSALSLTALRILSELPTPEVIQAVADRFKNLFARAPEPTLDAVRKLGAKEFLPLIEYEYRTGEWNIGEAYLLICHIHHQQPERFREIEQDVARGRELSELHRRILKGDVRQWPNTVQLELACKECGRTYHYEVSDVHLHPYTREDGEGQEQDGTPYRHGMVICDDLRCKNCQALNQLNLTPSAVNQLTAESLKLLALRRSGLSVPSYYPVKYVQLPEKESKPPTLLEVEKEHIEAVRNYPTKPQAHLALGKFYEYVKVFPKAKEAYFKALDLDPKALEAMAGLSRLCYIEGKRRDAYDWIEQCYQDLMKGHTFLAEDPREFKKIVREKRREFARELGIHPKDEQIEIRFQIEEANHPKNRPCPCGSGKKYKLCCMRKGAE